MVIKVQSPFKRIDKVDKEKVTIDIASPNGYRYWEQISSKLLNTINFNGIRVDTKSVEGQTLAFGKCSPVAAIIGKIAEYSMNARYGFVDKNGKEVTSRNQLTDLMSKPNLVQTWAEFIATAATFIKLHGQCYVLPIVPEGFSGKNAKAMYVIPNWMVTPNYTGTTVFATSTSDIVKDYTIQGFVRPFTPDKLLVIRDTSPNVIWGEKNKMFEGMSRLYSLGDQVNNLIAIQDALYNITTKRGALGAWVPENSSDAIGQALPMDTKDKDEILSEWDGYGLNSTQRMYRVLRIGMKWVQASMSVGDLQLFQGNDAHVQQVAMAYNMPVYLLGLKDSTFTNLEAAGKACYTSAVIPLVDNICSNLTGWFLDGGIQLKAYFDHLEIFQKSKKDEADALGSLTSALDRAFTKRIIGMQEYRDMMAAFMPNGVPFDPTNMPADLYEGQPTQTIVTQ